MRTLRGRKTPVSQNHFGIGDTPKIRFLSPYQRVTLCPRQNCRTAVITCIIMAISMRGHVARAAHRARATTLEHFQAKHALGLDPGVDAGSPSENATTQREKSEARFYQNGIRSNDKTNAASGQQPAASAAAVADRNCAAPANAAVICMRKWNGRNVLIYLHSLRFDRETRPPRSEWRRGDQNGDRDASIRRGVLQRS
jgi:hypothetical protein